jgi:Asp-tRNA(Asn)/Glu-tRNA(Gln) amidotransferase C subunit
MSVDEGGGVNLVTEEVVAELARMAGFAVSPERLPGVTERLRDLYQLAADLDGLDLDGVEPATDYDPTWPEEATA